MIRTIEDLIKAAKRNREHGIEDDGSSIDEVLYVFEKVFKHINKFIQTHGEISLSCGSEWLYQDDSGRVDALDLVGNILDSLDDYAE